MIRIEHLRKEYPGVTPLSDVNAVINDGEIVSIIGPSGTGKSTLLRMLNRLEEPTSGRVYVDDVEITSKDCKLHVVREKMGMVFQSFNLFNHLNAVENVMSGLVDVKSVNRQEAYDQALVLLKQVGLADKALAFPDELSGGQKQRVAIARTLAMKPSIILFDEPTSALDPAMIGEVQSVIENLSKEQLTMLIVTHDMNFAKSISTRVFYMDQGIIYEDGSVEQIFEHPEKELTRMFIKQRCSFNETINSAHFDYLDTITKIEEFGRRIVMPQDIIHRAQLIFEELCVQTIVPHISVNENSDNIKMHFSIDYDKKTSALSITVRWHGDQIDPMTYISELPGSILSSQTTSINYSKLDDTDYNNNIIVKVQLR